VERNEEEQNDPGDPLNEIKPVPRIRISQVIWAGFDGNDHSIHSVIDQWYEDAANLHEQNVRNRLQIDHSLVEITRSG
jgi:hypothetical protein